MIIGFRLGCLGPEPSTPIPVSVTVARDISWPQGAKRDLKKMGGELFRAREVKVKEMTGFTPGSRWLGARAWWMSLPRELWVG